VGAAAARHLVCGAALAKAASISGGTAGTAAEAAAEREGLLLSMFAAGAQASSSSFLPTLGALYGCTALGAEARGDVGVHPHDAGAWDLGAQLQQQHADTLLPPGRA
jgi:hypothetical protein